MILHRPPKYTQGGLSPEGMNNFEAPPELTDAEIKEELKKERQAKRKAKQG